MKLCKDCKHFISAVSNKHFYLPARCDHEKNWTPPDPVYGEVSLNQSPVEFRGLNARCGPDALLWEKMPARPRKTPPRFWEFWK